MAAITAGRAVPGSGLSVRPKILALDSAKKLGAKILVAGGGRCNVTHHAVDESAYAGSSRHAIRKVLGRFGVDRTVEFFKELGVELKREETGKLFPTTDSARTVLDALLAATKRAGVELRHPCRVESIARTPDGFLISSSRPHLFPSPPDTCLARRVILATGGQALPKSGSDGHGYSIVRSLGHTVTRTWPALVPLTLPESHFMRGLAGITVPATLELRAASGKRLVAFTNSTLCTHFGLSGPSVLDISRYFLDAAPGAGSAASPSVLAVNWLPHHSPDSLDAALLAAAAATPQVSVSRAVSDQGKPPLPERLARALCEHARINPSLSLCDLTRHERWALVAASAALTLPVTGSKGFTYAEATAGGVPLSELHLDTMESRICPGLHICGELCDVDGRIGGFNFQWAWASGFVAGRAAAGADAHHAINRS